MGMIKGCKAPFFKQTYLGPQVLELSLGYLVGKISRQGMQWKINFKQESNGKPKTLWRIVGHEFGRRLIVQTPESHIWGYRQ